MTHYKTLLPIALLALACLVAGCDGADEPSAGTDEDVFTIGLSQANLAEPYRVQMNKDIEEAVAKHANLKLVKKDASKDSNKQRSHVEEFVSQGVDLIIISPNEPDPLTAPVKAAMDAGIPVIVLDRRLRGEDFTTFIGADNYRIGKAAGEWIKSQLPEGAKVVELEGMMSTIPAQDRKRGFRDAIEGSNIDVVFTADMQWEQARAKNEMESALSNQPQIDLVYAHNDPGAYGAYLAAAAVDRAKGTKFVGIDALESEGQTYVRQGFLDASFEYPTGGREAVEAALQILTGEDVPKEITLDSRYFTPANIAAGGEPITEIVGG